MSLKDKNGFTYKSVIKRLYRMMFHVHNILVKHGIPYMADAGTLLGAIRHKGIIPWDDDLDIRVDRKYIPQVLSKPVIKDFESKGYKVIDGRKTKGWINIDENKGGKKISLDIFISQNYKGRYKYVGSAEKYWPRCSGSSDEMYPLKKYQFGSFFVYGPNKPQNMMKGCYGKNWRTVGYMTQDELHYDLEEPIRVKVSKFVPARPFYETKRKQLELASLTP